MNQRQRITWIDTTKGIAILLLLFSHSMTVFDAFKTWIFAFHMPIFFIICGYLAYKKYPNGFKSGEFLDFLSKRWYNLFKPYLFFGTILILFLNFLRYFSGNPIVVFSQFTDLLSLEGIESLWFLPVYFFAELILITILGLVKNKLRYLVFLIIVIILYIIDQPSLTWPMDIVFKIFEGSVFAFTGYTFAKTEISEKIPITIAIILFIIASLATSFNLGASMISMNNVPLYLFNAIIISLSLITIIQFIEEKFQYNETITYFGKNSLIVVCTNNLVIEIIRLLDFKLFNNSLLHLGYLGVILFFIIITICEYPLLKVFEGQFKRK